VETIPEQVEGERPRDIHRPTKGGTALNKNTDPGLKGAEGAFERKSKKGPEKVGGLRYEGEKRTNCSHLMPGMEGRGPSVAGRKSQKRALGIHLSVSAGSWREVLNELEGW